MAKSRYKITYMRLFGDEHIIQQLIEVQFSQLSSGYNLLYCQELCAGIYFFIWKKRNLLEKIFL